MKGVEPCLWEWCFWDYGHDTPGARLRTLRREGRYSSKVIALMWHVGYTGKHRTKAVMPQAPR